MELYRVYFRMLRHHIRGVLLYVLTVAGIVAVMTIQIPRVQNFYADEMLKQYSDMWASYSQQIQLTTEFHLYQRFEGESENAVILYTFLNYAAFSIFSLTTGGICLMLAYFQNRDISRRIKSAPITNAGLMGRLISGSSIFALMVWLIHIIAAFCLIRTKLFGIRGLLIAVNILSLTIAATGFAFLTARFSGKRGRSVVTASILSIVICFTSGIFTPQFVLSNAGKTVAVFTPTYWYARANSIVGEYQFAKIADYAEVLRCVGMQLLFAVGMLLVAIAVDKHREKEVLKREDAK